MAKGTVPNRLYKYRAFSDRTLEALFADQIFFADPSTFNDPLDTRPTLEADIDADALAEIFVKLVEERVAAEMSAAAKRMKYRGPKTADRIASLSRRQADRMAADIRYNATNPEFEMDDPAQFLFGRYVEDELLCRYDRGIFSLAESAINPLMWSHYGDQHKGISIGYSVPDKARNSLLKVRYGGSRLIAASTVAAMLGGDPSARHEVDDAVFTRKAAAWRYEKEWRLIGQRGSNPSPLELEEIVFGMRCPTAIRYAIVKGLSDRSRGVRFFEIREVRGRFTLKKYRYPTDELFAFLPNRVLNLEDALKLLSNLDDEP